MQSGITRCEQTIHFSPTRRLVVAQLVLMVRMMSESESEGCMG